MKPTSKSIVELATASLFGKPIVANNFRAIIAESIVASCLGKNWRWVSADWAPYDFLHSDGTRLEVKQSAACQTWSKAGVAKPKPRFDIAERKGFYDAASVWCEQKQRNADIYLFAYHPIEDRTLADHRDPLQWIFYIARETDLPPVPARSISLTKLRKITQPVGTSELEMEIERIRLEK